MQLETKKRFFNTVSEPLKEKKWPDFSRLHTAKGLTAAVVALLFSGLPREWSVVTVAGILLLSRKMHTRSILGLVNWHLITLFYGLFVVVEGFNTAGIPQSFLGFLESRGVSMSNPFALTISAVALSNVVSNVPATVLLSPHMPQGGSVLWYILSLANTYVGNLLSIGSMANLTVIEQARLS